MSRDVKPLDKIKNSKLRLITSFIKSSLKEINPWQNIQILHTNIKTDVLAGITVAIIALPLALAFGEISQLGPEAGIWSAIVGGVIGGLFGGCIVGVSGPTAPMASQLAIYMGAFLIGTTNEPDLVAAFSIIFLSGFILVIISMFKISRLIHYLPYSVIAGFMCGIGVIVILSQINSFLGIETQQNIIGLTNNFKHTFQNINFQALKVSLPCLIILFLWPWFQKKLSFLSNIPSALMALVLGSVIANFMNLDIAYIGEKMNNNDKSDIFLFYLPDFSRIREFIGPAFILSGLAVIDSLLSCKVADNLIGIRHNSDRETFGQGMANMASGLLGGISTATATTQTVANIKFGAKTPLATIMKGLTLLSILYGLGFLVEAIPLSCLAAILFKVGIEILDYRILPVIRKIPLRDLLTFIIVLCITVYQDIMIAIVIGLIFAFIFSIKEIVLTIRSNYNHKIISASELNLNPDEKIYKELISLPFIILRPQGPLFFGALESLLNSYASAPKHEILIIDMSKVNMIDLSGIYLLEDLVKISKNKHINSFVINATKDVKFILEKIGFIKNIGTKHFGDSLKSIIPIIKY